MDGLPFLDADGRRWVVMDFKTVHRPGGETTRRRVPLESRSAEGRAFVPDPWDGNPATVMLNRFGAWLPQSIEVTALQQQLDDSYPSTATAGERMQRKPYVDRSAWHAEPAPSAPRRAVGIYLEASRSRVTSVASLSDRKPCSDG